MVLQPLGVYGVLIIFGSFVSITLGEDIDHWGTNFVFTFPKTEEAPTENIVVITAREITEIKVTSHSTGAVTTFILSEGEAEQVVYGDEVEPSSDGIMLENFAISVIASNKVSVYAYTYDPHYTEAMLILPVPSLGIDYMVVNLYTASFTDGHSTYIVIVAVDNYTEVSLQFKSTSNTSFSVGSEVYYNGQTLHFNLNDYDVFNIKCSCDTTGSRITSNKPIGVISGSNNLELPVSSRIDPVMEMLPPVTEFGTQFSLIAPEGHTSAESMLRIVPLNAGTSFVIKGLMYTPAKGEAVDIKYLTKSETVCFNASDRVIVVIFMAGAAGTSWFYYGDAYMSIIPPIDRTTNNYVVFNNALKSKSDEYRSGVNIVAKTAVTGEITPDLIFEQSCNGFEVYSKTRSISRVMHYHAPSPFLLLIYGFSSREGFGFPAGMKLSDFSGADDCASSPCQNGGWCIDTTTSFRCYCEDSRYSGTFCEIGDTDHCLNNACQHGSCVEDGNSYNCNCFPGYAGAICQSEIYVESTTEHVTTTEVSIIKTQTTTTEPQTTTDVPNTEPQTTTDAPPTEPLTTTDAPNTEPQTTTDAPPTDSPSTTDAPPTDSHSTTDVPPTDSHSTTDAPPTDSHSTTDASPTDSHSTTDASPTDSHSTTDAPPTDTHSTTDAPPTDSPSTTNASNTEPLATTDAPSANITEHQPKVTFLPIHFPKKTCNGIPCMCQCPCNQTLNRTVVMLHVKEQQTELIVEKKTLSKTVRRKISSENLTSSESNLGLYTVVVILLMVAGVLMVDSVSFFIWINEKIKSYKQKYRNRD